MYSHNNEIMKRVYMILLFCRTPILGNEQPQPKKCSTEQKNEKQNERLRNTAVLLCMCDKLFFF